MAELSLDEMREVLELVTMAHHAARKLSVEMQRAGQRSAGTAEWDHLLMSDDRLWAARDRLLDAIDGAIDEAEEEADDVARADANLASGETVPLAEVRTRLGLIPAGATIAEALETDDSIVFSSPELRITRLVKRDTFDALKRDHDAMLDNLTTTQVRCNELLHAERVARKALLIQCGTEALVAVLLREAEEEVAK